MPDRRLGRAHRQRVDIAAEQAAHRVQFQLVAERGRGAVRVDVIDVGQVEARLFHRHLHRAERARAFGVRRGDVISIARQAIADHLGIDFRAARLGVFIFLEADHACALAHDEAVAILVIGAAGAFGRRVEARRQRARLGEAGNAERADRALGAARQHHIGIVHRDHPRGVADRMRAGRASGDDGMVGAHQTVFDLHLAGDQVDQATMHEMRGDAARAAFVQHDRFAGDARQAANARSDRAARAELLFLGHVEQAGIFQRLSGGIDAIDDERIDLALHLMVDALAGVETVRMVGRLHLARDSAGIVGRVETRDRAGTRFRRQDIRPGGFDIGAQRRHQPQSGYDNTAHGHLRLFKCS
ncbi:hypothetical protein D9M73_122310 [compost metagenome]